MIYVCILEISEIPKLDKLKAANVFQNTLTYNHFNDYTHKNLLPYNRVCVEPIFIHKHLSWIDGERSRLNGQGNDHTFRHFFLFFFVFSLCLRLCASVELTVSFTDRHENWSNDPAYPTKYKTIPVIGLLSQLLTDSMLTWSMTFKLAQTCVEQ